MKFLYLLQILLTIIGCLLASNLKKYPDPSYNPIRSDWISGPRIGLPIQHSKKYAKNHRFLLAHHHYHDNTRKLARKALMKK